MASIGDIHHIWLTVIALLVFFQLGLTYAPGRLVALMVGGALVGLVAAPGATVNVYWLFVWLLLLPHVALAHLYFYGVPGLAVVAAYWLLTWATGRWERVLRKSGAGEMPSVRGSAFWRLLASYYPARLHLEKPLREGGPYLLAIHPHGLWGAGVWCNIIPDPAISLLPRRKVCTLNVNFYIPIIRDILFAMGLIGSGKESIRDSLAAGFSVGLIVGGGREAGLAEPGTMDLVLGKRFGFVKLAMEAGASLVPVLTFGETALYTRSPTAGFWEPVNRLLLRSLGMSLPILQGRWATILPAAVPLYTVVGEPMKVAQCPEPSQAQVEEVHAEYCKALRSLYDRHKDHFDKRRARDMRIVD